MFEDIYKARPNVKEEIKEMMLSQVEDSIKESVARGDDEKILQYYREAVDEQIDVIVEMYVDFFTTEELISVIDWCNSDEGKKAGEFNHKMMTPVISNIMQQVMFKVIRGEDEEMADELEIEFKAEGSL